MIRLKAYAKINLSLQIIGQREDDYHEIDSLMQSISLFDLISLSEIFSGIELAINNPELPKDKLNLAYRAAELFFNETGLKKGIKIDLKKNIPIAAGLAGGSADAAAVLIGLNELFKTKIDLRKLQVLGATLGSDVPFCLAGGRCLVKGWGEVIEKLKPEPKNYFILVCPNIQVSTKWAYDQYDRCNSPHLNMGNSLEPIVIAKYPEIQKIKNRLIELGAEKAQMSGSGPAVFGIVENHQTGQKIFGEIKKEYSRSYLVESVDQGIEID